MRIRVESRLPPLLLWPFWVWILVAAEVFVLWGVGVFSASPELHPMERHFWSHEVRFGVPGGHSGVLDPIARVNIAVVLGLWIAVRSARGQPRRFFVPLALTALAGAVVLAAISSACLVVEKSYPPLEVDRVLILDEAGDWQVRELGGSTRAEPGAADRSPGAVAASSERMGPAIEREGAAGGGAGELEGAGRPEKGARE